MPRLHYLVPSNCVKKLSKALKPFKKEHRIRIVRDTHIDSAGTFYSSVYFEVESIDELRKILNIVMEVCGEYMCVSPKAYIALWEGE